MTIFNLSRTFGLLLSSALLLFANLQPVSASLHSGYRRSHNGPHWALAKRQSGDVLRLGQSFTGSRWTWYDSDIGLGACGQWSPASDFVVALNRPQFGLGYPGKNCFKTIAMTMNGKTARARIVDECPECPWGALDLSRSLFRFFAPEDVGIIYGNWYVVDANDGGTPPPPPKPQPAKPPKPPVAPVISMVLHPSRPSPTSKSRSGPTTGSKPAVASSDQTSKITTEKTPSKSGFCKRQSSVHRVNTAFSRFGSTVVHSANSGRNSTTKKDYTKGH